MKTLLRALLVGSVVAFGASAVAVAGDAADPVVGTWKINLEKSKFSPGPAVKSQTRVYTQSKDGITVKVDGVAADGSTMSQRCTYKYDGKDYAFTGTPLFDTLSLKQVDEHTVESTQKKAGKAVGTTHRTLSADGRVLTLESKGTNAKGEAFYDVMVFDRQ
jgi:hypothetical protein